MQLDEEFLSFPVRELVPVNPITCIWMDAVGWRIFFISCQRACPGESNYMCLDAYNRMKNCFDFMSGRLLTLMWSSSLRSFAFSSRSARSKGNPGYRRESWRDKRNESLFVRSGFSNVSCTFTSDSSIEYRRLSFSIALSRSCMTTRPNRSSAVKKTKTSHTSDDGLQGSLRVAATFFFTPNPSIHSQNIEQKNSVM